MSHSITITDSLYNELKEYCDLNNIKVSNLCGDLLKKGINELKYGEIPFGIVVKPVFTPIEQELVPVQPMSEPSGASLDVKLFKSEEKSEKSIQESVQNVQIEEKKEEIKTKTKRTRILN